MTNGVHKKTILMNMLTRIAFLKLICNIFIKRITFSCLVEDEVVNIGSSRPSHLASDHVQHDEQERQDMTGAVQQTYHCGHSLGYFVGAAASLFKHRISPFRI